MRPVDVSTVEELHEYFRLAGRDWDDIGWRGDPAVRSTDGTTLVEERGDGSVEVTGWSRGQLMSTRHVPDVRAFVQDMVSWQLKERLRGNLSQRGLRADVSVRSQSAAGEPDEMPDEGRWAVVVSEGEYHIGGMSLGRFRHYDSYEDVVLATDVLQRLVQQRGPTEPAGDADLLVERGRSTGAGIVGRTRERGHADAPGLGPGDVLDRVGHESGSQLFALGTPFAMRSQPPDMAGGEYHRYRVLDHLPFAREGTAAPWFGQPGGGAMVVGDRPVRWYLDHGHLVELVD